MELTKGMSVKLASGAVGTVVQEMMGQVSIDVNGKIVMVSDRDVTVVTQTEGDTTMSNGNMITVLPAMNKMPESVLVSVVKSHRNGDLVLSETVLKELFGLSQTKFSLGFGELGDMNRLATQMSILVEEYNGNDKLALSKTVTVARDMIKDISFGESVKARFKNYWEIKGGFSVNAGYTITHVLVEKLGRPSKANKSGDQKIGRLYVVIGGLDSEQLDLMKDGNGKYYARKPWSVYEDRKTKENKFTQRDTYFEAGSVDAIDVLQYLLGELAEKFLSWAGKSNTKVNMIKNFIAGGTNDNDGGDDSSIPDVTKTEDKVLDKRKVMPTA